MASEVSKVHNLSEFSEYLAANSNPPDRRQLRVAVIEFVLRLLETHNVSRARRCLLDLKPMVRELETLILAKADSKEESADRSE